jgi:hypothetical protein
METTAYVSAGVSLCPEKKFISIRYFRAKLHRTEVGASWCTFRTDFSAFSDAFRGLDFFSH